MVYEQSCARFLSWFMTSVEVKFVQDEIWLCNGLYVSTDYVTSKKSCFVSTRVSWDIAQG